jgi:WhiB family redox-sensing transcriptional regulator
MSQTPVVYPDADKIPFPVAASPTACRRSPHLFSHEVTTTPAARADIEQAKRMCAACPIAASCLKWALTHPAETRVGVWAATTARERTRLRQRLAGRLGTGWVTVIADRDQRRKHATLAAHSTQLQSAR